MKDLQLLFKGGRFKTTARGEVLYSTDQPAQHVFLLASGFVKRYFISSSGDLGVQAIYGPGDIFPFGAVFKALFNEERPQGYEVYYYETMTKTTFMTTTLEIIQQKVEVNSNLYQALLQTTSKRFHAHVYFLENLRLRDAYCKTAHQLAYFGIQYGKRVAQGVQVNLPLAH